jgi:wobble nucleotide-excising tRNase
MKITRIDKISNARVFRGFVWPTGGGMADFGRFNLVYGWNGSGKTTLSELLRHMEIHQAVDPRDGQIQLRIDGQAVRGEDLGTAVLPPVRVFNRDSVDRSVFEAADGELPPVFVLGEESVEKQQQLQSLTKELGTASQDLRDRQRDRTVAQSDFDSFCTDRARQVKLLLTAPGGGPYNNYDARSFKATAVRLGAGDARPQPLDEAVRNRHLAAKEGTARDRLTFVVDWPPLDEILEKVERLLARTVQSDTIAELESDPEVATWVADGLALHTGGRTSDTCRFCTQPLPSSRLDALRAHFNDQFQALQLDIGNLMAVVDHASNQIAATRQTVPDVRILYENLAADYKAALAVFDDKAAVATELTAGLHKALAAKAREPFGELDLIELLPSPSEPIGHTSSLATLVSQIHAMRLTPDEAFGKKALEGLSAIVDRHNTQTDDFQATQNRARAALEFDTVLSDLAAFQKKLAAIEEADGELERTGDETKALSDQVDLLKRALRQHQRPAEELTGEMASYLGHSELRFEAQQNGYTITRSGQPALNLSEGERTAIAFMYFLKSLDDTSFSRRDGVVVIDDPVSSLDANSLFSAFGFMRARTENVGQLFVLTHNFTFFRQVRSWFQHMKGQRKADLGARPARFYMLCCRLGPGGREAQLEPLDPLLERYQSEYQFLFERVFRAANRANPADALSDYYGLPNMARRLLETFLAFRVPQIDGLEKQLESIDFDQGKRTRVLRFLHTESHFAQVGDPEHDLSLLSESQAVLQNLMELIQSVDRDHYAAMVSLVQDAPEEGD